MSRYYPENCRRLEIFSFGISRFGHVKFDIFCQNGIVSLFGKHLELRTKRPQKNKEYPCCENKIRQYRLCLLGLYRYLDIFLSPKRLIP